MKQYQEKVTAKKMAHEKVENKEVGGETEQVNVDIQKKQKGGEK